MLEVTIDEQSEPSASNVVRTSTLQESEQITDQRFTSSPDFRRRVQDDNLGGSGDFRRGGRRATISRKSRRVRDHIEFFRQFRSRFKTTGAVAPSSRLLARALTGPLKRLQPEDRPLRILEVGPGTGAVTRRIVQLVRPQDRFDLVEINEVFAEMLTRKFDTDPAYRRVAEQSQVHVCPLQDHQTDQPYDIIVSGLPLNNFPVDLVDEIFQAYFRLLAPGGTLSYFEYMYVRPLRQIVSRGAEKQRLGDLSATLNGYLARHRFRQSWVLVNVPPAWVQHLQNRDETAEDGGPLAE